ncbi:hypothetical protein D3C83_93930 [compost metagenome]
MPSVVERQHSLHGELVLISALVLRVRLPRGIRDEQNNERLKNLVVGSNPVVAQLGLEMGPPFQVVPDSPADRCEADDQQWRRDGPDR